MLVWRGFLRTANLCQHFSSQVSKEDEGFSTFVVSRAALLNLLRKTRKVDDLIIIICIDVQELNARAEVIHELAKSP
jgi:hypothetical protein